MESLQSQNRQLSILALEWVKRFLSLVGHGPKVGPKMGFGINIVRLIDPTTHVGPTFGTWPANDNRAIFDPVSCKSHHLTTLGLPEVLAPRDAMPIVSHAFQKSIGKSWSPSQTKSSCFPEDESVLSRWVGCMWGLDGANRF